MRRRKSNTQENSLDGWTEIIQEQGRRLRGESQSTRVDCSKCGASSGGDWSQCGGVCPMPMSPHYRTPAPNLLDDSGPYPTEREVEEMNAPGEDISDPEELPAARCARGIHQQAEREPWKCQHCAAEDVNPPDSTKLVLVFCPWLVAERSDPHNWVLKQRRKVESGANAGRYGWRDCGYYGTPGQAATKAMHLIAEGGLGVGGVELVRFVELLVQTEEKLRGPVQQAATSEARAAALAEVLGVVRDEKDCERIQKLMGQS